MSDEPILIIPDEQPVAPKLRRPARIIHTLFYGLGKRGLAKMRKDAKQGLDE